MSNNETVVVIVLILAIVIVVIARFSQRFRTKIHSTAGDIEIESEKAPSSTQENLSSPKKRVRKPHPMRPWLFRHWRIALIGFAMLLVFAAPIWWWTEQPAPWRMLLSYQFHQLISLIKHGSRKPLHANRSQATLDSLARTLEMRADKLNDRYRGDEIWIVDHYWQYWNTQNLQDYLSVNQMFVAKGGKIHRMFLLTREELQNPDVQVMLHTQCRIGKLGDDQTGNGFELWRADPGTMKDHEEYQTVSRQFRQLPDTDESFEKFDVVQFNDTLYYSSDFSTDYRVLGSSTWIFDPAQISKIDLRPLFKRHIAERIACDERTGQGGQQEASAAAPPHISNPI